VKTLRRRNDLTEPCERDAGVRAPEPTTSPIPLDRAVRVAPALVDVGDTRTPGSVPVDASIERAVISLAPMGCAQPPSQPRKTRHGAPRAQRHALRLERLGEGERRVHDERRDDVRVERARRPLSLRLNRCEWQLLLTL
jgi:hypothetical protein